ncbi:MAG: IS4 family transposase, partial [Microcystaceae cyanobacterium]
MLRKQSVNIRQMSQNRAEQVGYYRFLENEKVAVSELIQSLSEHCEQQVEGLHVLAINDTSEINLEVHRGRLKPEGQGVVGNNRDIGFFLHPTLVLNSENGFPLGISSVQLWNREESRPSKEERNYQKLPIEEKESNKWLVSASKSQNYLSAGGARMVTHIGDRESDLYEAWATIGDGRHEHLLVRSSQDRRLLG